jgi:hypothetical protein
VPVWAWLALVYVLLLAISFARAAHTVRISRAVGSRVAAHGEEWARRAVDVVLLGDGDITIGAYLGPGVLRSAAFRMQATDGAIIDVARNAHLGLWHPLIRRHEQLFVAGGGLQMTAYMPDYEPGGGDHSIVKRDLLIIAERGYQLATKSRLFGAEWRPRAVALVLGVCAALVAGTALYPPLLALAIYAGVIMLVDIFMGSMIVTMSATTFGSVTG